MQGVAAKNDASSTSLPNGRIVTRGCPAPTQWRSVGCVDRPPNKRLKLAAPGGQGRIPLVIDHPVRRSLSAIRYAASHNRG
jgi:hypothetical protein